MRGGASEMALGWGWQDAEVARSYAGRRKRNSSRLGLARRPGEPPLGGSAPAIKRFGGP